MPNFDTQVTTTQAADALGTSRRQVIRLVDAGRLVPLAKLPGRTGAYLFDPADVQALIDGPTHTTEDTAPIMKRGA